MQKTRIALFPLQVFLLPGEKMQLHIFEERYRQLLNECQTTGSEFGIPYTENGQLTGVGCVVRLIRIVDTYDNGSSDIEVECTALFKVNEFYSTMMDKLYPGGDVSIIEGEDLEPISANLMCAFNEYVSHSRIEFDQSTLSIDLSVFEIASFVGLNERDKLKMAKLSSWVARERLVLNQIAINNKVLEQSNSIEGNFFLN